MNKLKKKTQKNNFRSGWSWENIQGRSSLFSTQPPIFNDTTFDSKWNDYLSTCSSPWQLTFRLVTSNCRKQFLCLPCKCPRYNWSAFCVLLTGTHILTIHVDEGTSLVVQLLRIRLPMQEMWVRSFFGELRSHKLRGNQAHALQQEKPKSCNKDPAKPKLNKIF